jgi:transglutaminase-like putative cysteine protease
MEDAHPCPEFIPKPPKPISIPPIRHRLPEPIPIGVDEGKKEYEPEYSEEKRYPIEIEESRRRYTPIEHKRTATKIVWSRVFILFLIALGVIISLFLYYNPQYWEFLANKAGNLTGSATQFTPSSEAIANETENTTKNESINLENLPTDILGEINKERVKQGAGEIFWNDTIAAVARIYSNNTLLYGNPTYINGSLDYSIEDVSTYTLYLYESCTYNATGSLKFCTYVKHIDSISKIIGEWLNETKDLLRPEFTDGGVGVVVNGSYAYITLILTDTQAWERLKAVRGEPSNREFTHVLRGNTGKISMTVYSGIDSLLAGLSRWYSCNPGCPSDADLELRFLNQKEQKAYLVELVDKIKSQTNNKDDQARIAISLVQKIPYDYEGVKTNQLTNRYPYEVLYDDKGVCGEKSHLLAFLLRELGYGVVLIDFKMEQHMAVGIECPAQYAQYTYNNLAYCFVEAANSDMVTDNKGTYVGGIKLTSSPEIIPISDGNSFDSVSEEYKDAQEWYKIMGMGQVLDPYDYSRWQSLVKKYGIEPSGASTSPTGPAGCTSGTVWCNNQCWQACPAGSVFVCTSSGAVCNYPSGYDGSGVYRSTCGSWDNPCRIN